MHRLKHIKLNSCGRKEVLRQRLSSLKHTNFVGAASALALALLALVTLSPTVSEGANAEAIIRDASSVGIDINSESVVSIALDKANVTATVVPTAAGSFTSQDVKLTVQTNNLGGYKLLMSIANGKTDQPELVNQSVDTAATIKSTASTLNGNALANNTWGYSISKGEIVSSGRTNYNKITNGEIIAENPQITEIKPEVYTLSFGAKVGSDIPAGQYSAIATVSAVANPIDVTNLQHLTYMQDMTHDICAKTRGRDGADIVTPGNEITKQLIDTRDGNVYWVAKLADQNCWMTQNLALDIDATKGLRAADTDITEDWNSISQYPPESTGGSNTFDQDRGKNTTTRSWSLGKYILKNSSALSDFCVVEINESLDKCTEQVQKLEEGWYPTFTADDSGLTFNLAKKTYDAHYSIGNWYAYNSATAGTGGQNVSSTTNDPWNASGSICPKNWMLPSSEMVTGSIDIKYGETFQKLINAYQNTSIEYGKAPLYLVNSGYVRPYYSNMNQIGYAGFFSTRTAGTVIGRAYELQYLNDRVNNVEQNRYYGFSVRCVAR